MRNLFLSLIIILLGSCSNGMNKPIIETMTVEELQANIKNDTTFTEFYTTVQHFREWILASDINQATYGDITYKRLKKFFEKGSDTTFVNKRVKVYQEEYAKLYPDYSQQIDSIVNHWREYQIEYELESFVKIEFEKLWKEYYSYSGDVKTVNVGFKVTPLKGTIDQLVFRYNIKSKITDSGSIGLLEGKRCLASSPISKSKTLYWEADYSDEKILKQMSDAEVKRDYNFNIEIVEIRVKGENIKEKVDAIPFSVSMAIKYNSYDNLIKEFINKDYQSMYEFTEPKLKEDIRKVDEEVFAMMEAYDKRNSK